LITKEKKKRADQTQSASSSSSSSERSIAEEAPDQTELLGWDKKHTWKEYSSLVSDPQDYDPVVRDQLIREKLVSYILSMRQWALPPSLRSTLLSDEDEELILRVFCRNRRNAFCYGNGVFSDPQGYGLYVAPALLNHSCDPNLMLRTFQFGPVCAERDEYDSEDESPFLQDATAKMQIRSLTEEKRARVMETANAAGPLIIFEATRDIAKNEEINISYLDNGAQQWLL